MILGDKVFLRRVERDDLPHFMRWMANPATRRFILRHQPMSLMEEENWFDGLMKDSSRSQFYCIVDGESSALVGNIGLRDIDLRSRSAELGIMIGDTENQDKGYGTDAMRALVRYAFEEMNLNRIQLRVHEDNPRAIHVYEKIGFAREGVLRQADWRSGRYSDVWLMAVLRDDWLAARRRAAGAD